MWAAVLFFGPALGSAVAEECDNNVTAADLDGATAAASLAATLPKNEPSDSWQAQAHASLRCVTEILSQESIARFHRMKGALALRRGEGVAASNAWQAARTVYPALVAIPGQPESWERVWDSRAPVGTPSRLPEVPGAEWIVNGLTSQVRTSNMPVLAQLVDERSSVLWTGWLAGGSDLPAAVKALVAARSGPVSVIPPVAEAWAGPFEPRRNAYLDSGGARMSGRTLREIAAYDTDGASILKTRRRRGRNAGAAFGLSVLAGYATYLFVWDATVGHNIDPQWRAFAVGMPAAATAVGGTIAFSSLLRRRALRQPLADAAGRVAEGRAR